MSAKSAGVLCGVLALALAPATARAGAARFEIVRAASVQALSRLGPQVLVRWRADRPTPAVVRGLDAPTQGRDAGQRARDFLRRHAGLVGTTELVLLETRTTGDRTVVRLQQRHRGVPVLDAAVTVALDRAGHVRALHSSTWPVALGRVRPSVGAHEAVLAAGGAGARGHATLAIDRDRLVYVVSLPFTVDPTGRRHLVDARTGAYLGWRVGVILDGKAWKEVRR